ncbi:MAG: DegT/DnrJ/EryC1/StrS aminotransferase family protein [Alcaligenaceae bacterium]|nr:DegT/DnrJ/EryC1/StrS aminotransferase family protein [Alcaligenaceae bacterium]
MLDTNLSPWPAFTEEEADAVHALMLSGRVNYWTGEECRLFEREFAQATGCAHAVALANGTLALEIALRALEIGPGDEVVVTPRSFIASASCVVALGATPVFADIDLDSQNITAESIAAVLSPRTRAIICVHLAGWPCDMDPIMALAHEHALDVIEDCAQAHGAFYKGRPVGSLGHIAAWSFCQDKILSTGGEGGMITTNDPILEARAWAFKDHGKSRQALAAHSSPAGFRWLHHSFGTNARMMEVQAAIGRIQLRRLPAWSERRRHHAQRLWETAAALPGLRVPVVPDHIVHAAYKCYVFADHARLKPDWGRDRIQAALQVRGVPCYTGSCPEIYRESAFDGTGMRPACRLPNAEGLGQSALMFLVHPTLRDDEIDACCAVLTEVLQEAALPAAQIQRAATPRPVLQVAQ